MESEKYLRYCGPCKCGRNPILEYRPMRIGNSNLILIKIYCSNNRDIFNYNIYHNNLILISAFKEYSSMAILDGFNQWNTSCE